MERYIIISINILITYTNLVMVLWSYGLMVLWSYGLMVLWSYFLFILYIEPIIKREPIILL